MLNLNGITVRLGGRTILDRATAALPPYSRIGLIGRNGAGKSTLMKVMIGSLEADDGSFELKAPTSGSVVEVNETVFDKPELINESPFDDGWIFRMNIDNEEALDDLMDEEDYADFLDSLS